LDIGLSTSYIYVPDLCNIKCCGDADKVIRSALMSNESVVPATALAYCQILLDSLIQLHNDRNFLAQDATPWYRKPNLAQLYLFLVPAVMDVEWISGFDGSIMDGLQVVESWDECKSAVTSLCNSGRVDFNRPRGVIPGIMNSIYSLGVLTMMPIVPGSTSATVVACPLLWCRS
jgi:hypothetical protein